MSEKPPSCFQAGTMNENGEMGRGPTSWACKMDKAMPTLTKRGGKTSIIALAGPKNIRNAAATAAAAAASN